MCLKFLLEVHFNVCMFCKWCGDIEAETPHGTCTYVDEICIHGYHASKDFCTSVINEVAMQWQSRREVWW